ncbi:MAG: YceI family protein [Chitinophagaceae bacterium]|nr:YceI family protein [Chitinophagaceae bacterium]
MLKKSLAVTVCLILITTLAYTQGKYFTKAGKIEFYSKAPLEDIEAKNKTAAVILDARSGAVQFSVLMKGFEFDKALMQEHFNENYVESDKYPKSEFKGQIVNNSEINYNKSGTYTAKVKGKLSIHGQTRDIETSGNIKVDGDKLEAHSRFNILLSDYNIKIPKVVKDNISKDVKIIVDCKLEPLKG